MTFIKWLFGFVLTFVLVLLVAVIVIPMVIDPNDYRDELTALVNDKTGRELTLGGDLDVSVFPWLGIRTKQMRFSQPDKIGGDMIAVDTAQLRVKLVPLFSKKVEIDTIVLEQPRIRLITLEDGSDSFAGLMSSESDATEESDSGAALALVVQGVVVTDGSVIIENRQTKSRTELTDLNLATGNLIGDTLATIKVSGKYSDGQGAEPMAFALGGRGLVNTDTFATSLENLELTLEQQNQSVQAQIDSVDISSQQLINVSQLTATIQGPQTVSVVAPTITADLSAPRISIPMINAQSGVLKAAVNDLVASTTNDVFQAKGKVNIPSFNVQALLKSYEIDYAPSDKDVLQNVSLSTVFDVGLDNVSLTDLSLELDGSTLRGSAGMRNVSDPAFRFDLSLDSLNLDRYLPESDAETDGEETSNKGTNSGAALAVPMAVFKDIPANGTFKAQQLIAGGIKLSDINVSITSADGSVEIVPVARLYDGKLDGRVAYAERDGAAQLNVKQQIDLVQLLPLLSDADVTDQLSGLGTLDVDVQVTERKGVQSNSGTIELLAKNGVITGVDMTRVLAAANVAASLIDRRGEQATEEDANVEVPPEEADVTKFGNLVGTFLLNDSVLTNNDLQLNAPGLAITGTGTIDLEQQTLDYRLQVRVQDGLEGALGESLERLKGRSIPMRCRFPFDVSPCVPDAKALFNIYLSDKLDQKKGEYLQEKLGIEGGEKMSTKEALKQALLQKALKNDKKENVERPIGERDAPMATERPLRERSETEQTEPAAENDDGFANVPATVEEPAEKQAPEKPPKSEKEQLKDELKKKLIEGLFDSTNN